MRNAILILFLLVGCCSSLQAQPPGPFSRGDRGGDDRGGDDRSRSGWDRSRGSWDRGGFDRGRSSGDRGDWFSRMDPSAMLRRADKNGDGRVEPNEIDERFRGFTSRMLERYGFDPSKPVKLDDLSKKYQEQRDGKTEDKDEEDVSVTFGIPGFDDADESLPPLVPDFFLQPDSPLLMAGSLESRYDRSILDQVDRTLRMYDRNQDGILSNEEISRGRFTSPPVEESDLDRDGRLTKVELAERYVSRAGGKGRIENGKSTSSRTSTSRDSRSSSSRSDRDSARSSSRSEKSSSSSSRSRSSASRSGSSSRDDKITSYAQSILKKYDKDGNGKLDSEESKSIRSLPPGADKDKNGEISLSELVASFGGSSSGGSSTRSRSKNTSNPYIIETGQDRSNEADRDFQKLDTNVDGLVQMHEFTDEWSDEKANSFAQLDANNDGVVTISEWSKGGGMRSSRSSRYRSSRSDR